MTWFSDVERFEVIAIVQLLINSNRVDLIIPALRQGLTLDDVRSKLAAEAAPAAPAAGKQEGSLPVSARLAERRE
jgi:hypothetical protein